MAKKKTPGPATIGERLRLYVDRLHQGNKSAFAKAIGCSHTAVNKIVANRQEPGAELLAKLGQTHPEVNLRWLLTGTGGEPFEAGAPGTHTAGWPVPISRKPLPGSPVEYREMLQGTPTFPVPGEFYRASRYFFSIPADAPITTDFYFGAHAHDLVLLDADREAIKTDEFRPCRLCIIRCPWDDELALAEVRVEDREDDGIVCFADTFEDPGRKSPEAMQISFVVAAGFKPKIAVHPLEPHELPRGRRPRPTPASRRRGLARIELTDIVAVAVLLIRPTI